MSHDEGYNPVQADEDAYTGRDIPYRALYIVLGIVLLITVVFAVFVYPLVEGLVAMRDRQTAPLTREAEAAQPRPPGPLLQQSPELELEAYEARMSEMATSYSWQDRSAGIARIPVARAKELILDTGLGVIGQPAATASSEAETSNAETSGESEEP